MAERVVVAGHNVAEDDHVERYFALLSAYNLESEIIRAKAGYEYDPDNQADNFACYLKACETHIYSLEDKFFIYEDGAPFMMRCCICEPIKCSGFCIPTWVRARQIFMGLKRLIWESWLSILKAPQGEKHLFLRDAVQFVQGLPVIKVTENHLQAGNMRCAICTSRFFQVGEEAHHLPCNKARIFHRPCIENTCLLISHINDKASELIFEFMREKTAYEADPDNQADNFAYQLYMLQGILESLQEKFYQVKSCIGNCICGHILSTECHRYRQQLQWLAFSFAEVTQLMWASWLSGLSERVERQIEREIVEVVQGFPVIQITENQIDDDVECPICLSYFEVGEELCHLSCNEGHIFHRNCIQQWLYRKNHCPICRKPAYCQRNYFYPSVLERLEWLMDTWPHLLM